MIFGSKNLSTANEIIDSMLESGSMKNAWGAIAIHLKEGRKTVATGNIYFYNETVYAASISNHEVPIGQRVATGGLVEQEELEEIYRRVGGTTDPRIADLLLESQLIGEKPLLGYIREHFIDTLGEILSWDNCLGEWYPNSQTNEFKMPYVSMNKIRMVLVNRQKFRKEFNSAVQQWFRPEETSNLVFERTVRDTSSFAPEIQAILALSNGEHTTTDIAHQTGITEFNVFKSIVTLWKKGQVTIQLGGISLPFESLTKANEPVAEEPKPVEETPEEYVSIDEDSNDDTESQEADDSVEETANSAPAEEDNSEEYSQAFSDNDPAHDVPEEDFTLNSGIIEESDAGEESEGFITYDNSDNDTENSDVDVDATENNHTEDSLYADYTDENVELLPTDSDNTVADDVLIEKDSVIEPSPETTFEPTDDATSTDAIEPETETAEIPPANIPTTNERVSAKNSIAAFSSRLHELQEHVGEQEDAADEATAHRVNVEKSVDDALQAIKDIETRLEAAKHYLDETNASLDEARKVEDDSRKEYDDTCAKIEELIQSFKFSG